LGRTGQRGSQVVDVYFPKDRATNRRKNFCFVTFATQQASCNCVFLCALRCGWLLVAVGKATA